MSRHRLALATVVVLCTLGPAQAQVVPTGSVEGQVKDSSGAIVPGASVAAQNLNTGETRSAVTSEQGIYIFNQVPVATYRLERHQQLLHRRDAARADRQLHGPARSQPRLDPAPLRALVDLLGSRSSSIEN